MLNKKELLEIPLLPFPTRCGNNQQYFVTVSSIRSLPRSGTVLVADIYRRSDKSFHARVVADGSNYLTCNRWPAENWTKQNPAADYWINATNFSPKEDTLQAERFLGKKAAESWRSQGVLGVIDSFITHYAKNKKRRAEDSREELRKQHFAMYPPYPEDLEAYCEKHVFAHNYMFFGKLTPTGRRYGQCCHCGNKIRLPKNVKQNQEAVCHKCGRTVLLKADWRSYGTEDTARICITAKVDGQLLIRWTDINRYCTFGGGRCRYRFSDYGYNLYLLGKSGKRTMYAYGYNSQNYYGGGYWKRYPNGTPNTSSTYIYANNLREVFGEKYYNCDLQQGLAGLHQEICFTSLLNCLRDYPEAEYLFKMRLPLLAADAGRLINSKNKMNPGFSQLLGVSKQLLPMYQNLQITYAEHCVLKDYGQWVSPEEMLRFRALKIKGYDGEEVKKLLRKMSFGKFVRYFTKQKEVSKKTAKFLMEQYRDYLSMARVIGIDLTRKDMRFPADVCKSHDLVLEDFNKVTYEKENEAFANAVKPIYAALPVREFENEQYCIVLPQLRTDLTAEGKSLGHCVGGPQYSEDHMDGDKMIFFVRKINAKDKPFFTMQIDMRRLYIVQLYGKGNRSAPADVRSFANSFLSALKPAKVQNKRRKSA